MPPRKKDYEIIEDFNKKGLNVLDVENYKSKDSKLVCIDNNGYKYLLTYSNIKDIRTVGFDLVAKHNPYSVDNIKNFIRINNGNCELVSKEYINPRSKIKMKCSCGNEYNILWYHLEQHKKFTCNKCSIEERSAKKLKPYEYVELICKDYGYKLISLNTLRNIVIDDNEGYRYKTTIYSMQNNDCDKSKFAKNNPFAIQNMCNYIKLNDFKIKLVDESNRIINGSKEYLDFYCSSCGDIYKAKWGEVAYNTRETTLRHRCSRCSKSESNLEYEVRIYLDTIGVRYIKQKRFNDCKNILSLPFDFYLDDYKIAIEVQGDQHFYENELFSQSLEERKRIDKIKKDYCIANDIKYIAIPSWDIVKPNKKYKTTINNILNQN